MEDWTVLAWPGVPHQAPRPHHVLAGSAEPVTRVVSAAILAGTSGVSRPVERPKSPYEPSPWTQASTSLPARVSLYLSVPTRRRRHSTASPLVTAATRQPQRMQSPARRDSGPALAKSKRTRTGCLTCRSRHLKCDERFPVCHNCSKTKRKCSRGAKLKFTYVEVGRPPMLAPVDHWSVEFQDESREVASEYKGGLSRYEPLDAECEKSSQGGVRPEEPCPSSRLDQRRPPRANTYTPSVTTTNVPTASPASSSCCSDLQESPRAAGQAAQPLRTLEESEMRQMASNEFSVTSMMVQARDDQSPLWELDLVSVRNRAASSGPENGHGSPVPWPAALAASVPTSPSGLCLTPESGENEEEENLERTKSPTPPGGRTRRPFLSSPDEALFIQAFVEQVGAWMDSFDKDKHFSRLLPYRALRSPMLLNAFLACGARHLALVRPEHKEEKVLRYYDTATTQLLRSLQNPDCDASECAVTAAVLNVYEVLSDRPAERMSHVAGARALIRECGWDARSTGIGAACFWLNIAMEVLSCLAFNWQTSWDPDQWGVNMDFGPNCLSSSSSPSSSFSASQSFSPALPDPSEASKASMGAFATPFFGDSDLEQTWIHRLFYIMAKISNFRATASKLSTANPHDRQVRLARRLAEWYNLKRLCDSWNACCPRTMYPLAYAKPGQSGEAGTGSVFPRIWLTVRASALGRLFYHTAECLLAQTKPATSRAAAELRLCQLHHARQICGIVAHMTDPGTASVAIRSLAIAAAVLTERSERQEVLRIMDRIHDRTGCRLDGLVQKVTTAWGWEPASVALDKS